MKRYKILIAKLLLVISALFFFGEYEKLEFIWIQALALVVAIACLKYLGAWDTLGRNK